ncbi:hypothetical protein [Bdellovibrio svalbardensis]|uniref:Uncharacterized protein n=1 Tax=Bdellovibrio svalbardensis TaxID=2972972 RepID=A0ABT6DDI0_9BACT|nr:hypothetical protein [Bdellovibrio svalbardensis]MDG0814900.1 hypothetical protein [Bdellovibrio svalbardensis]
MKLLVLVSFLISTTASASVWKANRSWTEQDEVKFSLFLQSEWAADVFANPQSDFYGIKTDCADAVYAARIVFSAREGLPVKFSDVTKSGSYLTQEMSRWDGLSPLERIKRFISYTGDLVSTLTLESDTYPVAINKDFFRPGVIFLSPILSDFEKRATGFHGGHAEYVKRIDDIGFIEAIASTSPKAVRTLSLNKNPYMAALVTRGGFRRWRQPQQFGVNVENLTGYSLEQFNIADWAPLKLITRRQIYQWHEAIRRTLRTRAPSFDERVDIVVDSICSLLTTRAELVQQGWSEVTKNGGRCLSADLADQYSTDSRDQRIRGSYFQLGDLYDWKKREDGDDILGSVEDAQSKLEKCRIQYWPGRFMNTWEIYPRVRDGLLESSASYAPAVRWGFRPKGTRDCR